MDIVYITLASGAQPNFAFEPKSRAQPRLWTAKRRIYFAGAATKASFLHG